MTSRTTAQVALRLLVSSVPLLVGVSSHSSTARAQEPGTFTATGNMTVARTGHTATLLLNGKVLIAGGRSLAAFDAELYDPSTGTSTATGNMTTARWNHTATLLADGRVLIAGGNPSGEGTWDYGDGSPRQAGGGDRGGYDAWHTAELYDPSTGTFTATGGMILGGGLSVLLANGKVLIVGGPYAELYDPATGAFAVTGAYALGPQGWVGTATLLADGRVLITGCTAFCKAGWTELYDPVTGTFSLTGPMNGWANVNTATLLMNGKVLIVGNSENDGFPAEAEVYDPATGTFARIGNTIGPHEFSAAALLPDGTALITGGQLPGGSGSRRAELYAPATQTFHVAGNMATARHSHTATLLPDGTVLIAGGYRSWPLPTSSSEIYEPPVLQAGPFLFSLSQDGRGQGAILHPGTADVASPSNPAEVGEPLEIYCTGLVDGSVIPPQVAIGGQMAEILFFGNAPGWPGLNQLNVRVPSDVAPGPAVPVRLTYLGRPSNEVTIGVR
jgi:hypothetical protein